MKIEWIIGCHNIGMTLILNCNVNVIEINDVV